ncbi:MAG: hypothetical protein AAB681_01555 [Patescibacteria group bacterium]
MKYFFLNILIVSLIISPITVGAQPVPVAPGNNATLNQLQQQTLANQKTACLNAGYYWENNKCSKTSTKTQQTLQRFRPGVDIQSTGKKVGGISFSGVGSSVLGCLDVGGETVKGISNLFTKGRGFDKLFKDKSKTPKNKNIAKNNNGDSTGGALKSKTVPTNDDKTKEKVDDIKKKETCLDAIAYTLSRQALSQVTNKTLNWINTGFDGNPFYIKNTDSFLKTIEKESFLDYIHIANQTDNQIIGQSVSNKLIELVTGRRSQQLDSLPKTEAEKKYDAFSKNFKSGGWGSWLNVTVNNENPLGQFLGVTENLSQDYGKKEENLLNEANQGSGFLSVKKCAIYAQISPDDDQETINSKTGADGTAKCLRMETTTPGSILASQTQTITNTNTRQLEAADELNEVLGAFFDSMLNKLIQKGLNGLEKETAKGLNGNYSAHLVSGSNIGGASVGYQSAGAGIDVQDFDISRPQQLRAVMQAQYDFLNTARDSQIAMERILPSLSALDYCIPGPNPTWTDGLDSNLNAFLSSLETPTKDATNLEKFLGAATSSFLGGLFGLLGISGEAKELNHTLIGEPALFDKTTEETVTISPWSYLYATKDYSRLVSPKNTDGNWIRGYVSAGYDRITDRYQKDFTNEKIIGLFTAVDPNANYATGAIGESISEISNLMSYNSEISSLDIQYSEIISDKEDQLAELETIREEANEIVRVAKARYIASQAAAGTPVNLSCINRAYIIDTSPIVGRPRQESDAENPMVQQMLDANDYFYTTL